LVQAIHALRAMHALGKAMIPRMGAVSSPRSANRATLAGVGHTPPPLSLRLGHAGTQALEALARARGISKAEAARQAIEEAAEMERRRSGLAAEVERLMKDPAYVEESREIAEMMEELRGPW
jgi:predicted DNA-binding protein